MRSDGQKSLRDYFASEKQTTVSSPSARSFLSSPSAGKRTLSDDEAELSVSSTPAKKSSRDVIVIDSDFEEDEENIFVRSTKYRNPNFIHSPSERNIFRAESKQLQSTLTSKKKNTRIRPGKWSCAACTYSNHPLISYCEMCCTSRDSQPTCSSTESPAHSDLVAGASSEVQSFVPSNSCNGEVSKLPSCRQNSSNCLPSLTRENRKQLPNFCLESDVDDVVVMSEVSEFSNSASPVSAVCDNTSRLRKLDIDGDRPSDDNCVSDSFVDKNLATGVELESPSESNIDFSNTTAHEMFQFSCSRNSSRIYVYDKVFAAC